MTFVSVLTATCNRASFIPDLIKCYMAQTHPKELMEWIVLDDGESVGHLFAGVPGVEYIHAAKQPMGAKLNILKKRARGDVIVIMDDDDYYPPERIETAVKAFTNNPQHMVAGCSKVYMHFADTDEICVAGPYSERHALNCTLAWRAGYNGRYDDEEPCAVEHAFLKEFTEPIIQLDTRKTILHRVHLTNTFKDKRKISLLRKTNLTVADFISVHRVSL